MKRFIFFIIVFVIMGCRPQSINNDNIKTIKFNFNIKNPSYDKIYNKTDFILLETDSDCLVSTISQMEVDNDKMFILDWKINSLFVFTAHGKFLNKIGRIGKGPGEYIRPRFFYINKEEATIKVFDAPTKKLICFDYTGKFIEEIKLNKYLRAVGELKTGYWGFCANYENEDIDNKGNEDLKFITFNPNAVVEQYIYGKKSICSIDIPNSYIVSNVDSDISYIEPFMPYIFSFNGERISKKYKIDFSDHSPSNSFFERLKKVKNPPSKSDFAFLHKLVLVDTPPSFFVHFYENNKWVILFTLYKDRTIIYNKTSKKTHEYSGNIYTSNIKNNDFTPCHLSCDTLYFSTDYSKIKKMLESDIGMPVERKEILKEVLHGMKNDDNPVIIKCTINE